MIQQICDNNGVLIEEREIPDIPQPAPEPSLDDITALQLAVAELAEAQAADQTANELAMAELAEMIGG